MPQPYELSAIEAAGLIRRQELSPVDLMQSLLDRIDALEPALKAWVWLDRDAALAEAKAREEEVASSPDSGTSLGLLHGIPVGVKDIYYTAGIPTTACSRVYADFVPEYDATTVALLKRAGAIMLGKTVTTEFACMDPSPTVNPWNPAHTPGGSSSGSAVAVASQMCPAALGSQTVGSVLRPASYNGVVGFKPSYGRVSRYGVIPVSWSLDTMGWMSRTVADAALLLQVMAGPDANDPVAPARDVPDYSTALASPQAPRIGLLRQFFYDHADAETRQHTDAVVERLAQAGAVVEELALPPSMDTAIEDQQVIMAVEGSSFHEPMYRRQAEDYQPGIRGDDSARVGHRRRYLLPRPGAAAAVYHRYETAGGAGGHSTHPVHTHAVPARPDQHRQYYVPGAVDLLRPAGDNPSLRVGRLPGCPWGSSWLALTLGRTVCWRRPGGVRRS